MNKFEIIEKEGYRLILVNESNVTLGYSPASGVRIIERDGNVYDFAFGLNWNGAIADRRTERYR